MEDNIIKCTFDSLPAFVQKVGPCMKTWGKKLGFH